MSAQDDTNRAAREQTLEALNAKLAEDWTEQGNGAAWEPGSEQQPHGAARSNDAMRPPESALTRPKAEWLRPLLDEVDAAELAAEEGEDGDELEFLPLLGHGGYLVKGWSHLLVGAPRSGKTELLAACIPTWLQAGETILFFTEESRDMWRMRLRQRPGPWAGMRLVFGYGAKPTDLLARMKRGAESVVILDTIRGLGVLPHDECDNGAIAAALSPWITAARQGKKSLTMSHHMRKGGGADGEGISGGHALLGVADIALEIIRDKQENRRTIRAYARLIRPENLLYECREDGLLVAIGDPKGVSQLEVRRRLTAALNPDWAKTAEVMERLADPKPGEEQLRKALVAEAKAGTIERDPPIAEANVAGKRVRWRRCLPDVPASAAGLSQPGSQQCVAPKTDPRHNQPTTAPLPGGGEW
jgi:hypothetical protein